MYSQVVSVPKCRSAFVEDVAFVGVSAFGTCVVLPSLRCCGYQHHIFMDTNYRNIIIKLWKDDHTSHSNRSSSSSWCSYLFKDNETLSWELDQDKHDIHLGDGENCYSVNEWKSAIS